MKKHRTTAHTEKGKHVCKKCRSTFSSVLSKRRHALRCMEKVDPIVCPQCRKGFFSSWNFKRHVRLVHEPKEIDIKEEKPRVKCKICEAELVFGYSNMEEHLRGFLHLFICF